MTSYQKGLLLTGFGGLLLTFDIPVLRLAGGDLWPVQFVRTGLGVGVALLVWGAASLLTSRPITLLPGRSGVVAAAIYGLSAIFFVIAIFNTTAANTVFILAFSSMFAALLSWLVIGERPAVVTFATMAVMIGAVTLIVGDSVRVGSTFGDLAALAAAFSLAAAITVSRASGTDMGFAPMLGGLLPLVVAAGAMAMTGIGAESIKAPWWLIFDGAILLPLSFWCIATGPKYLTGPEVAMFLLLETVLAPVWVWMIFDEAPTRWALIGGAIIVAALVFHTLWQLRHASRTIR